MLALVWNKLFSCCLTFDFSFLLEVTPISDGHGQNCPCLPNDLRCIQCGFRMLNNRLGCCSVIGWHAPTLRLAKTTLSVAVLAIPIHCGGAITPSTGHSQCD